MTRRRTILQLLSAVLLSLSCISALGQEHDIQWAMGTGRLYPQAVQAPPRAPKGYVPVYLSHYGRHGSRYMDGKGGYEAVSRVLEKAAGDGMLTPLGEDIWARYSAALPSLLGRTGELTPLGFVGFIQLATLFSLTMVVLKSDFRKRHMC